jgi:hypothetical protein
MLGSNVSVDHLQKCNQRCFILFPNEKSIINEPLVNAGPVRAVLFGP